MGVQLGVQQYFLAFLEFFWGYKLRNILNIRKIRQFLSENIPNSKLFDGGGLFLHLRTNTPYWKIKYRFQNKERLYSVGPYPEYSLDRARNELNIIKDLLKKGKDPVVEKRLARQQNYFNQSHLFEDVARKWINKNVQNGIWGQVHLKKSLRALERDVFPSLGKLPIAEITSPLIARTIGAVIDRGSIETASRIHQHITSIFRFAQTQGIITTNPSDPVKEILKIRRKKEHQKAILIPEQLQAILLNAEKLAISPAVRLAHRLCAFTAARIDNVVSAEWSEFNLDTDTPTWTIPRSKMKVKDRSFDHIIYLCPQIVKDLKSWRDISGPEQPYLFSSKLTSTGHISKEAVEKLYRVTLGLANKHSPHGWRSSLSTLARENGFAREVVLLALDQIHDSATARAYDRGGRLADRKELFDWWGNLLQPTVDRSGVFAIEITTEESKKTKETKFPFS